MSVQPLFHKGWPELKTVGQLVLYAKEIPKDEIVPRALHHFREIERLNTAGRNGPAMLRQLIVTSVLITRAVFELYGVSTTAASAAATPIPVSETEEEAGSSLKLAETTGRSPR